jgi:cob(I)alamin adenosyltransferase
MEEIAEEEGDPEKKAAKKLQEELEKRESGMEPSRVAVVVTSSAAPLGSGARAQARRQERQLCVLPLVGKSLSFRKI